MTSIQVTQRPFQENGEKIKRARESVPSPRDSRRAISHHDFAPKVGCTPRHLFRLERGEQRPSPELRNRIVEVTGTEERIEADSDEDEADLSLDGYVLAVTGRTTQDAGHEVAEYLLRSIQRDVRRLRQIEKALG